MNIYALICVILSTVLCCAHPVEGEFSVLKQEIELGQKVLDEKVERYNKMLKKYHQKKQQGIKNEKNTEVVVDKKVKDDSAVKVGDVPAKEGDAPLQSAEERQLRTLSLEIEEEQAILDGRVEYYNRKLQKKADQEEEEQEHSDLVAPLHAEIRRLTNIVEHLQKDMKEFKQTAIAGTKGAISPEKKQIQDTFEQALVEVKKNVRAGITKLVKFLEDYPENDLAVEANLQLGSAYNKIGRWKSAYTAFESVMILDKAIIPQVIEAKLGMAEAQIGKNDREAACMTLIKLEKSNNPMSESQLNRYQRMLVDYHCSSKMDRDERKKEKSQKTFSLLEDTSAKNKK